MKNLVLKSKPRPLVVMHEVIKESPPFSDLECYKFLEEGVLGL